MQQKAAQFKQTAALPLKPREGWQGKVGTDNPLPGAATAARRCPSLCPALLIPVRRCS